MELPWPTLPKAHYLPVTRTAEGYQQRVELRAHPLFHGVAPLTAVRRYQQPDLYHEEVVELDTPLARVLECSPRVHALSVLLLGDQNAGKTTLLHAFTYHHDVNYTHLSDALPLLAAVFVNARFLAPDAPLAAAMDQPPYVDTDLARCTMLAAMDDWQRFLADAGLPPCPSRAPYCVVQLLEVGGDHLDRLMAGDSASVCEQSRALLRRVQHAAYVVNCASTAPAGLPERRMAYLRALNPSLQLRVLDARGPHATFSALDVHGHIDVQGVTRALADLVRPVASTGAPAAGAGLAAEQLLQCWPLARENLYLDPAGVYELLTRGHQHVPNCVPASALVADFDAAVRLLAAARVAHASHDGRFAAGLRWRLCDGVRLRAARAGPVLWVRFPLFEPLYTLLCADARARASSSEWWAAAAAPCAPVGPLLEALEARIASEWGTGSAHAAALLVEDWVLAKRHAGARGGCLRVPHVQGRSAELAALLSPDSDDDHTQGGDEDHDVVTLVWS